MGDLHYNSDGTPVLILGHHVLFGKVLSLEKPFLLLKKTRTNVPTKIQIDDDDEDNLKENDDPPETKTLTSYIVKAVIRKKLLFNKRPRPIVYVEAKNRS
jgi:chromosome transmission fidelity protein 8